MPLPFVIIDGYNLMHAAGLARLKYKAGELEKAREAFLALLAGRLSPPVRRRTTVVFDAGDAPAGAQRRLTRAGLSVLFPRPGGDADSLIERLISEHTAPRQLLLVSSDHRLQRAARRRRARFVDSEEFAEFLAETDPDELKREDAGTGRAATSEKPADVSAAERDWWMQVFGHFPEAAQLERALQPHLDDWQQQIDELP